MSTRVPIALRNKVNRWLKSKDYQGLLVVDESLPAEHQGMLSRLRAGAAIRIAETTENDTKRPNIYFDFVDDDMRFNAVAIVLDGDYFILVNAGAIMAIPALFRNLFSLPHFARQIGDPSLEQEPSPRPARSAASDASVTQAMPHPERMPKCSVRCKAAGRFSQTAMNFLLLHELGHIRNGHLLYFFPGAAGQLTEAETFPRDQVNHLPRHTLEKDADSHAIVHGVNEAIGLTGSTRSDDRKLSKALYATPEASLLAYLLPIYALFRCFGRRPWTADTIWAGTHPPAAMRQYLLAPLVNAHLARNRQPFVQRDRTYEIARDVILEVERGLSTLTGASSDLSEFGRAAELWPAYGRRLTEYWVTAFPDLDKLKLGGRLAPPDPWRDAEPEETTQ
jgi:hypothetical protein